MIRQADLADSGKIADIYNHYIQNTVITFEEKTLTANDLAQRIEKVKHAGFPWLVAEENDDILGYAYASKWNERSAYKHTAEVAIYLSNSHVSKGWGTTLYQSLFGELRNLPIHIVIGGVTLPNAASIALHEKFGMKKVAHFEDVGFKFGRWLDVGYWQVALQPTEHFSNQ